MQTTVKRIVPILVMLSGILGAVVTFMLTLPPSETIIAVIAGLTTMIAVIAATIKLLREIANEIEKEVTNRT